MCRLLFVRSEIGFEIKDYLGKFSAISKTSKEYQGHGWGCSYFINGNWHHYKNITPVWEDDLSQFGKATAIIAHARSAFRDEGITVENNMPFHDDKFIFIFNGELRGVKIKSEGRIGAEKIFNYIKRFDQTDTGNAIEKATSIIKKKTTYIRAMNIIMCDGPEKIYAYSLFNEDPQYFTMYYKNDNELVICSMPFPNESGWKALENNSLTRF